jgi:ATPase family associated with various cellular activities (AAA)
MAASKKATSTELTGGVGFTYEDTVVAYYLAALLRRERAAGQSGLVASVAVQQSGHGHPMDDLIVEFEDNAVSRRLALQVKRSLRISAKDNDFGQIMAAAIATRGAATFDDEYLYGFVTEQVAVARFRSLNRIIDWAKASPNEECFERRFADEGAAAADERAMRLEFKTLTGATTAADEANFYRHFVALRMEGLEEGGVLRTEQINRLQEIVVGNEDGQVILLFDRLCRLARDGAATARKWTRASLLAQLRGAVRLRVAPNYVQDVRALQWFGMEGLEDIAEGIDDFHVARPSLIKKVRDKLAETRLVNISGMPGCGKSVVLKHFASEAAHAGPILFLKSDRLVGTGWSTFASALGLRSPPAELLAEIGATGTPILFIDGIDRVRPDQKGIITDILRAIETKKDLQHWRVVASSRDQGLEPYRAWFPSSFYRGTGIGDVTIKPFSDEEAEVLATEKPQLRRLLFGMPHVKEIARRPFFAAVLARSLTDSEATPQTEIDLISEWWARAGHDALPDMAPQRQRALLNLAEAGVRRLGKNIASRDLKDSTFTQIAALKSDHLIRERNGGSAYSFSHDIFFEWTFFRLLIELGDAWHRVLGEAGEPPLLGRVVGLLAQNSLATQGAWTTGYRGLEAVSLRPQWRREWLTAPPFEPPDPRIMIPVF